MYPHPEWIRYFQQMQNYLISQNRRMDEMNQMMQQLMGEINELKQNSKSSSPPVIRNEYKFDLLKIERLEGTLNIGLRPDGNGSSIDEFAVDQSLEVPQTNQEEHSELFQRIQQSVFHYLDGDAYTTLQRIEQNHNYPLDDPYRTFIIDDVKRQINQRIQLYLKQVDQQPMSSVRATEIEQSVLQKVKKDIDNTFHSFIQNLPRKEKSPN